MHESCDRKCSHINMQIYRYKMNFFTNHDASHFSEKKLCLYEKRLELRRIASSSIYFHEHMRECVQLLLTLGNNSQSEEEEEIHCPCGCTVPGCSLQILAR